MNRINARIGKRLDGREQLIESAFRALTRQKNLKSYFESIESVPKTRHMGVYSEKKGPGPEIYSQEAAKVQRNLLERGPQKQTTVAMKHMKGERGQFLLTKPKHDYNENYHHTI